MHGVNMRCFAWRPTWLGMSKRNAIPESASLAGFGHGFLEFLVQAMASELATL